MRYLVAYIATTVVFLGLDAVWLTRLALDLYRREVGTLLLDRPNLVIAGVFYLLFAAGLVVLAVVPALNTGSWVQALLAGALLGLVAYGTYDITNLSTLKGWSLTVTMADLAWGTALSGVSALAGYLVVAGFKL